MLFGFGIERAAADFDISGADCEPVRDPLIEGSLIT